jgi:cytidine deaminase
MKKNISIDYNYFENSNELSELENKLFDLAKESRLKAYAPYSKFLVGCAILLENGEIISGNNQENAAYPSGICAERTAIFYASAKFPDVKIQKLFVIGALRKQSTRWNWFNNCRSNRNCS